jgi:hypothetical protein
VAYNSCNRPKCILTEQTGTPKTISKVADSGKTVTSHFCPDCGTTLLRTGDSFPNQHVIKSGVLDDPLWANKNLAKVELFAPREAAMAP